MPPRVARLGFMLEPNGCAPTAEAARFWQKLWLEADPLLADTRTAPSRGPGGTKGCVEATNAAGP